MAMEFEHEAEFDALWESEQGTRGYLETRVKDLCQMFFFLGSSSGYGRCLKDYAIEEESL